MRVAVGLCDEDRGPNVGLSWVALSGSTTQNGSQDGVRRGGPPQVTQAAAGTLHPKRNGAVHERRTMMANPPIVASIPALGSPDRATTLWHQGRQIAILLTAERTNGQCSVVLSTECPGSEPPRHCHQHEDETCYVLAGTLTYHAGDGLLLAPAGTCIFLPRGIDHTFVVHSPEAQVLTLFTPGGFEGCLRELGAPHPDARGARAGATHDVERMIAVAARYGCEITGPPPMNEAQAPADGRRDEATCSEGSCS